MQLKELKIEMRRWGEFQGKYIGQVKFEDGAGEITLTLGPSISEKIFEVVSNQLIESSTALANNMTNIIQSAAKPQLEHVSEAPE